MYPGRKTADRGSRSIATRGLAGTRRWLALAFALWLVALGGCQKSETERFCERWSQRVETCLEAELPASARTSLQRYCLVTASYQPQPGDALRNLAALSKAALEECAAHTTCEPFRACLERHRCAFMVTGPDDRTPQFQCSPAASR